MTVLSVMGGKGPGPIEGEEHDRTVRSITASMSPDELGFYNQLKEFLGTSVNEKLLVQAIKSHGSQTQSHLTGEHVLNDLLSIYFDRVENEVGKMNKQVHFNEHLEVPTPAPSSFRPSTFYTRGTSTDVQIDEIDLASDEDKAITKWTGVSRNIIGNREEQDVIKAIEESLKDNQNIPGFAPVAQKDPENPYERRRINGTPLGLKNIGNSCWFNVIMETLYHIPQFQRILFDENVASNLILNKSSKSGSNTSFEVFTSKSTVPLLIALRRLAAHLHASNRAYVDPTDVLKTISDLNANLNKAVPCIGIQQDATEMLLRLIEWLERAFKEISSSVPAAAIGAYPDAMDTNDENMLPSGSSILNIQTPERSISGSLDKNANPSLDHSFTKLFHGSHFEIRPTSEFLPPKLENSLQMINLDVTYDNLHNSLEAYHLSDAPAKELWFESVPPVIIFSLVRFSYKNGQTEKVHSKFHFPPDIFMDRYLHRNRCFVNEKRMERNALKDRLAAIKKSLERWEKYPVGDLHLSLPSALDAVIKYTSSNSENSTGMARDDKPAAMEICSEGQSRISIVCNESSHLPRDNFEENFGEYPVIEKSVIPEGVNVEMVNSFLRILAANAQQKIDELQKEANDLQERIDSIFNADGMHEEPFQLHSVIVHEGEANVGHYWAYIASRPDDNTDEHSVIWRKFNDSNVETATWQQIEEDSFGSRRTCSAYCLVYTRKSIEKIGNPETLEQLIAELPHDLKIEVLSDNAIFEAEMSNWDKEHPISFSESENQYNASPSNDAELRALISPSSMLDVDALEDKHYRYAGNLHGSLMVKSALDTLRAKGEINLNSEEGCLSIIQEIISNYMEHYKVAYKMSKSPYADRLMFMLDWARIFGIAMSSPARSIFLLRMLSCLEPQPYPKLVTVSENVRKKIMNDHPNAENVLKGIHLVYEVFCKNLTLTNELIKKSDVNAGTRTLRTLLQGAISLCASIKMMDSVEKYATLRIPNMEEKSFIHLVHNMLMIIHVIKISRILINQIISSSSEIVLSENQDVLGKYFGALLSRLCNIGNSASQMTVQYIVSSWNKFSFSKYRQAAAFNEKLVEITNRQFSIMPDTNLDVTSNNTEQDVYCLRQVMAELKIKTADDLNVFTARVIELDQSEITKHS